MSKQAFKRLRRQLKLEVNRDPLPAFAWPGGYPMYYICADNSALCPDCVNKEIELIKVAKRDHDRQWQLVAVDINYEDGDLYCSHCNERIESAYAEPEDEYEVVCGNVGSVYSGHHEKSARDAYKAYVLRSVLPSGRASGESVVLFINGEIKEEYNAPEATIEG